MVAQDHHVALPMGNERPQARLKATLAGLGIPITPVVKCPLPSLSWWDRHRVQQAIRKIRRIEAACIACLESGCAAP
jgi:hypothetical protein